MTSRIDREAAEAVLNDVAQRSEEWFGLINGFNPFLDKLESCVPPSVIDHGTLYQLAMSNMSPKMLVDRIMELNEPGYSAEQYEDMRRRAIIAEIDVAAIRKLHVKHYVTADYLNEWCCTADGQDWPCNTMAALGFTS